VEEAEKYVTEVKAHHDQAKTKRGHGDAIRKAKFALALAEDALTITVR
jgi:hypothetical protein